MIAETIDRLQKAFLEAVETEGKLPTRLHVLESQYRYVTPTVYPIKAPVRQLIKERTAIYTVFMPEMDLNPGVAQGVAQNPHMLKEYWKEVGRAIIKDVDFVEVS